MGVRVFDDDSDSFKERCGGVAALGRGSTEKDTPSQKQRGVTNATGSGTRQTDSGRTSSAKDEVSDAKVLTGNNKEFRIENNKNHIRIVGNNNRIRISENTGDLDIIGNNTRLKIVRNAGKLKYTGNNGRVCLGDESSEQLVSYVGCNGVLKIVTSLELSQLRSKPKTIITELTEKSGIESGTTKTTGNAKQPPTPMATASESTERAKLRLKSASYGGEFFRAFPKPKWSRSAHASMPNLKQCFAKGARPEPAAAGDGKVVKHIESIVISNACNVSIRV